MKNNLPRSVSSQTVTIKKHMKKMRKGPSTVNEYLEALPADVHTLLAGIRKTIRTTAPKAEEVISYGIPGYKYHGMLVFFAAFKNHCSFFPGSSMLEQFGKEAEKYKTSKGTLQFTVEDPLPLSLVKKIVKERMLQNETKAKLKEIKKSAAKKTAKRKK